MYLNPNIYLSFLLSVFFFYLGFAISRSIKDKRFKNLIIISSIIIALPGFSMIIYYFHMIETPNWYITFRSIKGIEITNSLIGLPIGIFAGNKNKRILFRGLAILLVLIPYLKPIIRPLSVNITPNWIDNVCIQSTGATCGPSSLATIFNHFGIKSTEMEIARKSFSCSSGTEIWYILRYAKKKGLDYDISNIQELNELEFPSIIGTKLTSIGHFITILDKKDNRWIIGDPLLGRLEMDNKEFEKRYKLDGMMIKFIKR